MLGSHILSRLEQIVSEHLFPCCCHGEALYPHMHTVFYFQQTSVAKQVWKQLECRSRAAGKTELSDAVSHLSETWRNNPAQLDTPLVSVIQ